MIRYVFTLLWGLFLFVCTCTYSFKRMIKHGTVGFHLNKHPDWHQLFQLPLDDIHSFQMKWYLFQKLGHFTGFGILAAILTGFGRSRFGLVLAFGYAVLTEVLQLYFSRDGRLFDVLIDGAGIVLAWTLLGQPNRPAAKRDERRSLQK
ncbi:VanZ family protein [Paenibacillus sp. GCM10023250]|uniref:VanZ family protein n=1 Tax=Paenibacillus sp. GCM10023250 TaxID=3252648 RepID=UPI00361A922C